jgi:uncharacterized repeat protein (TIGR01451 family)
LALTLPAIVTLFLAGCAEKTAEPSQPEQPRQTQQQRTMGNTSTVALPTGDRDSSVLLLERSAPAQVQVGVPFDYTMTVTNIADIPLHEVMVKGTQDSLFQLDSASTEPTTADGESLAFNLGTLRPGQSESITVRGSASEAGSIEDCFTVTYVPLACLTVNVTQPALQLQKTMPSEVLQCEPIEVRYVVTNSGSGAANDVQIRDELPEGLVAAATGSRTVVADVGTLEAGQSRAFRAEIRAQRTGEFTNNATAKASGGLSAEASANITVRKPELEVTKTAPQQIYMGRPLNFQITVRNTGNGEARNATLIDQLPAGARIESVGNNGTVAEDGRTVTWDLGTLAPDAERTVSLQIDPAGVGGDIRNTATAQAYCAEAATATTTTRLLGIPAVLLEVIDITDPVRVGETTTYQITVTNQGSALDENIRIAFQLSQMELVDVTGPTGIASRGDQMALQPLPRLEPKQQATWRIQARAQASGDVRFRVQMQTANITEPVIETEATRLYEFGEEEMPEGEEGGQ